MALRRRGRALRRSIVTLATTALVFVAVAWVWARPAAAAWVAPLCDDRGATALAPPPLLEEPHQMLARAAARGWTKLSPLPMVTPTHRVCASIDDPPPVTSTARASAVDAQSVDRDWACTAVPDGSASGVRFRVERPPRG